YTETLPPNRHWASRVIDRRRDTSPVMVRKPPCPHTINLWSAKDRILPSFASIMPLLIVLYDFQRFHASSVFRSLNRVCPTPAVPNLTNSGILL
ncbi:MAG: hypothetical protein DWH73_01305, partial [Planctomycetota bacterium]